MYRSNTRNGLDLVSASRIISKRVTEELNFRKVLENEGFEVSKRWTLDYNEFWFSGIFRVEMG